MSDFTTRPPLDLEVERLSIVACGFAVATHERR
jgi:hypothetical protein